MPAASAPSSRRCRRRSTRTPARARAPAPARLRGLHPKKGGAMEDKLRLASATPSIDALASGAPATSSRRWRCRRPSSWIRRHARRGPRRSRTTCCVVRRHAQGPGLAEPRAAMGNAAQAFVEYTSTSTRSSPTAVPPSAPTTSSASCATWRPHGDSLDDDSLVHETLLILIGGDETRRYVISGGVEELLAYPDQQARLSADSAGLMSGAVEEMLRWVSPIKNMARTVTRDVELAGAVDLGRATVCSSYASANQAVENPEAFDITGTPTPHRLRLQRPLLPGQPAGPPGAPCHGRALLARLPDLHLAYSENLCAQREANFIGHRRDADRVHTVGALWGPAPSMAGPGAGGINGWSILVTGGGSGIGLATAERLAVARTLTICGPDRAEARRRGRVPRGGRVPTVPPSATSWPTRRSKSKSKPRWQRHAGVTGRIDGLFRSRGGSLHLGLHRPHGRRGGSARHHRPQPHGLGHLRDRGRRPCRARTWTRLTAGGAPSCSFPLGRRALPPPAAVGLRSVEDGHLLPGRDGRRGAARWESTLSPRASSTTS